MRIAFADLSGWDINPSSVDLIPLGGSQSAACYLARNLAQLGNEVFFISNTSAPGIYAGVTSLSAKDFNQASLRKLNLDVMVCVLSAGQGIQLREVLGPRVRLILWNQHTYDQAGVQQLQDARELDAYDGFAMVSDWQNEGFLRAFSLDPSRVGVLRNAIAPAFENLFTEFEAILPAKSDPPILAYTSTPFRGLNVLLDAFPAIRAAVPGARLQVFSSMKVYQVGSAEDEKEFGQLYQRCRQTAGVEYIGSVSQPELAKWLRSATVLAYPNTFAETSCIAVMEAMASGCRVVTSRLGALPETTAGYAKLVEMSGGPAAYLTRFIESVIQTVQEISSDKATVESQLRAQVNQVNANNTWAVRAAEWSRWLEALPARARPVSVSITSELFSEALQHHNAGRLQEAEKLYRKILANQPENADALHFLGVIALQTGRNQVALDLLRRAVTFDPGNAAARSNLGNALKNNGQRDEAIAAWRQAISLRPDLPETHYNLGSTLKEKGQLDEAIVSFQQAIAVRPDFSEAQNSLAAAIKEKEMNR